ncbi:MAG: DUF2141 domain-containing protein [candidate division FCPU426 bacterium]
MRQWLAAVISVWWIVGSALAAEPPAGSASVEKTDEATAGLAELQPESPLQPGSGLALEGRLVVCVYKIRNTRGNVWVGVFASPAGFPDFKQARLLSVAKIKKGSAETTFNRLPYGTYALAAFHDEDGNLKLTTNWRGKPKEGMGFSNNPLKSIYQDACFVLDAPESRLVINLIYP